ncbi:MAG: zinc-dependent alcohol dehydrogenase [Omnitrophica WOR_2 bacterium]
MHTEPQPAPKPGEKLVHVTSVGVCGSDLHWFHDSSIGDAHLVNPLILGHEFAGVIENETGKQLRVAVDPAINCQECEYCLEGNPNLCTKLHFAGHGMDDGALREYVAWPERCLYPLPDNLSDDDGAMLEPLGVALYALDHGQIRPGMSVGVYGCGPIGLLILQLCRLAGATQRLATDKLNHRIEAACAMGATQAFQAEGGRESKSIYEATGRKGVDVAFEVAGDNAAVETAVETVRPGGRVILVGIPEDDHTTFSASTARRKGITLQLVRRMKHTYPRAIELVEKGLVDVRSLVTHHFPLSETEKAFQTALQREGLKVIVNP